MNMLDLLAKQAAAYATLRELNTMVEQAMASDEGKMVEELAEFDKQLAELEAARLVVETKLLKYRFMNNLQPHLTVREASLISGIGEPSIRTLANPKRARYIETLDLDRKTVIIASSFKAYLNREPRM